MGKLKYVNSRESLLFDNFVWIEKEKKKAILIKRFWWTEDCERFFLQEFWARKGSRKKLWAEASCGDWSVVHDCKGPKNTQSTPEAVIKLLKHLDSPERKKAASELVYSVIQEASLPIANAMRMLLFTYHMDRWATQLWIYTVFPVELMRQYSLTTGNIHENMFQFM